MEQPKARLTLQQHQQAINEAIWIDASPHEWPTVDKMWLLCSALIDSVQMVDCLCSRLALVQAERDAARTEAARAVEALKRIAAQPGCGCKPICQCRTLESRSIELEAKMDIAAEAVEASKPALDWLAQQRREAAAEALKKLATDLRQDQWGSVLHDVDSLRSILRTRAAALRAGGGGND